MVPVAARTLANLSPRAGYRVIWL